MNANEKCHVDIDMAFFMAPGLYHAHPRDYNEQPS